MIKTINKFILLILFVFNCSALAQSVLDDISDIDESDALAPDLAVEHILTSSKSRKIFIVSNKNQSFDKGDFISIVLNNKLATRAIVAKNINNKAGIKIVKIYSLSLYNMLTRGKEVQILRGDDSYFSVKKKKSEEDVTQITDEEDLFNDTALLDDNITLDDNKKRAIKTDNIISLAYGSLEGYDNTGANASYAQFNGMWAYQVADNIWAEALYGQSTLNDFPSAGLTTSVKNLTIRGKYTFSAPMFSYIQPYIGYQMVSASGDLDEDNASSQTEIDEDAELQDRLKANTLVFGVTLLKRLVPGWFVRADLGTDILNVGFSLEF
jgi:hypothetical protein